MCIAYPENPFFKIEACSPREKNNLSKAGLSVPRAQELLLLASACVPCVRGSACASLRARLFQKDHQCDLSLAS